MAKTIKKTRHRDDTTSVVADIHAVSPSYVQKVRRGDRDDDEIIATCVEYQLGKSELIETLKRMVPITPQPHKYARQKK